MDWVGCSKNGHAVHLELRSPRCGLLRLKGWLGVWCLARVVPVHKWSVLDVSLLEVDCQFLFPAVCLDFFVVDERVTGRERLSVNNQFFF